MTTRERDERGRFVTAKECELERIVGGWWCRVHRRWADDGHARATPRPR